MPVHCSPGIRSSAGTSGLQNLLPRPPLRDAGLRTILNLRQLTLFLRRRKFKILTMKQLLGSVRPGHWFTAVDLKDAYFHVPASECSTTWTTDSYVPSHQRKAVVHTELVTAHLDRLSLMVNLSKSQLVLSQTTIYLGTCLNSSSMIASLSEDRIHTWLRLSAWHVTGGCHLPVAFGPDGSSIPDPSIGSSHPLQAWFSRRVNHPLLQPHLLLSVSPHCMEVLSWWKQPAHLCLGVALGSITRREVITTDASSSCWGAVWNGRGAQGVWQPPWVGLHINVLELQAVFLALQSFFQEVQGRHMLIRTDNATLVTYINHQDGLRSPCLYRGAHKSLLWAHEHLLPSLRDILVGILYRKDRLDKRSRGVELYIKNSLEAHFYIITCCATNITKQHNNQLEPCDI
ncbi:UNVERIFIED_CONTAM: hypothetical protein FKN15_019756 [Acipenser sinensis]